MKGSQEYIGPSTFAAGGGGGGGGGGGIYGYVATVDGGMGLPPALIYIGTYNSGVVLVEAATVAVATRTGTLKNFKTRIVGNTLTVPCTFTIRISAVPTAISIVVPALSTGTFSSVATAAIVSAATFSLEFTQVGAGVGQSIVLHGFLELTP